jgi:polyketide biosynthesis 3-hydroxy-3-methylglutaryl-CoA synthase-like enzyme PksG
MTNSTEGSSVAKIGIEQLNIYAGLAMIEVADLFAGRGLDARRLKNIQQTRRSIGLGCEDSITNAVNAAKPIIDALGDKAERIEALIVSTESGVDYSKSISSYVHRYLGLHRQCRLLEVKQACYAATGALQLAAGYLFSGLSPGAKVLVIATDVALVDARSEYAEPATGFGAAAILLGDEPHLLELDIGAFGLCSYETMDSARPLPTADIADVDRSLFAYLDCLSNSFEDYGSRVSGVDFNETFGQFCAHTPFAGLVQHAHRKMAREAGLTDPDAVAADFERRFACSLIYPKEVGNLCSGSLYLALASLLDHRSDPRPCRIGMFSYGSGCSSEFFSGVTGSAARERMQEAGLRAHLDRRTPLSFEQYLELLPRNLDAIRPVENLRLPVTPYEALLPQGRPPVLALREIKSYHRNYEWI